MPGPINLDQIEKKTWASHFEDGFWDIGTGFWILGFGLWIIYEAPFLLWPFCFVILILPPIGKKFITYPRTGRVKLGSRLSGKPRKMIISISCLVIGLLMVVTPMALPFSTDPIGFEFEAPNDVYGFTVTPPYIELSDMVSGLIMGLGCFLILGSIAYTSGVKREYAYGLLMAVSVGLDKWIDGPEGKIMILASGIFIVLIGLTYTVIFLRKYPRLAIEDMAVND